MTDLNKQALDIWNAMKPMIDREIEQQTRGAVQRRKAKVTTAPSLSTGKMGVTEPFGDQYFIPFATNLSTAKVGDVVWVEYMYGATNAFASMYASADTKNWTVGGVLDVVQRRCEATLSSAGWYRVMKTVDDPGEVFRFEICRLYSSSNNETHTIDYHMDYGGKNYFLNETSVSGNLYIDKIRCTHDSSNAYIDIHYNASAISGVYVHFSAEGVRSVNENTVAMGLASVAAAPSGETILAEYDFVADTQGYTRIDLPSTITAQTNVTLASIPVPKGRKAIEACIRLRSANSTGKMLIGLGDTICTVPDGDYQAVTLISPITTETTVYATCYVYNSSSITMQGSDNCILYRFI